MGTPIFTGNTLEVTSASRLASADGVQPHLNRDCRNANGVSLEVWVSANRAQGTLVAPVLVAGLSASVNSRNISLLQADGQWLGRVRTGADGNGGPDLLSTSPVVNGQMTHIVVVAGASERAIYVNGQLEGADVPGSLATWETSYRMLMANELNGTRPWLGSFEMVAMYARTLDAEEITQNYMLGPTAAP